MVLQQMAHFGYVGCCSVSPPGVLMHKEQQGPLLQEPPQSSVASLQEGGWGHEQNTALCWEVFNTHLMGMEERGMYSDTMTPLDLLLLIVPFYHTSLVPFSCLLHFILSFCSVIYKSDLITTLLSMKPHGSLSSPVPNPQKYSVCCHSSLNA